jgi:hypothetical protein
LQVLLLQELHQECCWVWQSDGTSSIRRC